MLSGGARGIADTSELDNQLNDPNQYDNPPDPATLSVVEHLRTLSDFGKLTLVYIVGAIFYLLLVVDKVIALISIAALLLSTTPLLMWWNRIRFSCPMDLVVRSFGLGLIGMFWAVATIAIVVVEGPIGRAIYSVFGNYTGIAGLIILVGVEEMVKVFLARWSKLDVTVGRETKAHQIAATATSVGYSVGFSFITVILLDKAVDALLNIKPDSLSDFFVALGALLVATIFGTPMHVLSGYLVGLEVTRQTHFLQVALYTFLIRSLFMVNILLWFVVCQSWQLIMFGLLLTNVLICTAMVRRIKRVEATLPAEYLHRVGYLQAFGYGVLPGGNVDEVEITSSSNATNLI